MAKDEGGRQIEQKSAVQGLALKSRAILNRISRSTCGDKQTLDLT